MTSKTYCVSWNRVYENSVDIDNQLSSAGLDYMFYNDSTYPNLNENWVTAEKIWYLGHFYKALVDFQNTDHSVFIFNAGDGVYDDYAGLTKKAEKLFESDPHCWAYAPCFTEADVWSFEGSSIYESRQHPGLVLSTHTNGIWVALSRELVEITLDFYEWMFEQEYFDREFKTVNLGWGVDSVFCVIAICMNKKIYRDWRVIIEHKAVSDYNTNRANEEMIMILNKSLDYGKSIGIDSNKMTYLINLIYTKMKTRRNITISEVYVNLENLNNLKV
ncbi:hypothetical protein EBR43_04935 [bacterium]|nr:hypothetical protein [bacterium]